MSNNDPKSVQPRIHAMMIAGGIQYQLESDHQSKNLRGTLTDKINVENFCYNYQRYVLHPTIRLSEDDAERVKDPDAQQPLTQAVTNVRASLLTDVGSAKSLAVHQTQSLPTLAQDAAPLNSTSQTPMDPTTDQFHAMSSILSTALMRKYYDVSDSKARTKAAVAIKSKVLRKLANFFDRAEGHHCLLFLSGHGIRGSKFVLNHRVNALLSLDDLLEAWDARPNKPVWSVADRHGVFQQVTNHLLLVIDACYSGAWAARLRDVYDRTDVSIQASSSPNELSYDDDEGSGGFFLNNFLFINGLKDLKYNSKYKGAGTGDHRKDAQRPTFFSKSTHQLEQTYRLRVGFNSWEEMEWRVSDRVTGRFIGDNGDMYNGEIKSIQLHGAGEKKLANGRIERGVFRNDKLHGLGTLEWDSLKCQGRFDQGQLVELHSAKLSNGVHLSILDGADSPAKHNTLIVQDDMVQEITRINSTEQSSSVYEWVVTRFANSDRSECIYRNGLRHGINFHYRRDGGFIFSRWVFGVQDESYSVDVDGIVEWSRVRYLDNLQRQEKRLKVDDVVGGSRSVQAGSDLRVLKGQMSRLFRPLEPDLWGKMSIVSVNPPRLQYEGYEYQGVLKDGKPHGRGWFKDNMDNTYDGEWRLGIPHGTGRYTSSFTRATYDGFWEEGMRQGLGKAVFVNGDTFSGEWKLDHICGKGIYHFANGTKYEGLMFEMRSSPHYRYQSAEDLSLHRSEIPIRLEILCGFVKATLVTPGGGQEVAEVTDLSRSKFQQDPNADPDHIFNLYMGKSRTLLEQATGKLSLMEELIRNADLEGCPIKQEYLRKTRTPKVYMGEVEGQLRHGFGVLTFQDGRVFEGQFILDGLLVENQTVAQSDETYCGSVRMDLIEDWQEPRLASVPVYEGLWRFADYTGMGELVRPGRYTYRGGFRNNKKIGRGSLKWDCGDTFEGAFFEDEPSGAGVLRGSWGEEKVVFRAGKLWLQKERVRYPDGTVWLGGCLFNPPDLWIKAPSLTKPPSQPDSLRRLPSHLHNEDGDSCSMYLKRWTFAMEHGPGVLSHPDGTEEIGKYEFGLKTGEWKRFDADGNSLTLTYMMGQSFEADASEDIELPNKAIYRGGRLLTLAQDGRLTFDKMHGWGVLREPDGTVYDGQFERGKRNGQCKISASDGSGFEGCYHNDAPLNGTLRLPNGDTFEGDFWEGYFAAHSVYKTKNGKCFQGVFMRDEILVDVKDIARVRAEITPGSRLGVRPCTDSIQRAFILWESWQLLARYGYGKLIQPVEQAPQQQPPNRPQPHLSIASDPQPSPSGDLHHPVQESAQQWTLPDPMSASKGGDSPTVDQPPTDSFPDNRPLPSSVVSLAKNIGSTSARVNVQGVDSQPIRPTTTSTNDNTLLRMLLQLANKKRPAASRITNLGDWGMDIVSLFLKVLVEDNVSADPQKPEAQPSTPIDDPHAQLDTSESLADRYRIPPNTLSPLPEVSPAEETQSEAQADNTPLPTPANSTPKPPNQANLGASLPAPHDRNLNTKDTYTHKAAKGPSFRGTLKSLSIRLPHQNRSWVASKLRPSVIEGVPKQLPKNTFLVTSEKVDLQTGLFFGPGTPRERPAREGMFKSASGVLLRKPPTSPYDLPRISRSRKPDLSHLVSEPSPTPTPIPVPLPTYQVPLMSTRAENERLNSQKNHPSLSSEKPQCQILDIIRGQFKKRGKNKKEF